MYNNKLKLLRLLIQILTYTKKLFNVGESSVTIKSRYFLSDKVNEE